MTVFCIFAISENNVIGVDNDLPWRIPFDLKWFKMHTYGHAILMGRRTWDSLPKKPLPGRTSIVLSRQPKPTGIRAHWFNHTETALQYATSTHAHSFVIGGADTFRSTAHLIDVWIVTRVHVQVNAPNATRFAIPTTIERIWHSKAMEQNGTIFHFEMYRKTSLASHNILSMMHKYGL